MLLKVERYSDNQWYWMYDGIQKISVSTRLPKSGEHCVGIDRIDAVMFDFPNCGCKEIDSCNDCREYMVLICRLKDGSEYSIAFDTVAYLLNDEGKTIEKIVANYKD